MVILLGTGLVWAQALTVGPTVGVITDDGPRFGLRLGFEPTQIVAIEGLGDVGRDGQFDAGLSLTGRGYVASDSIYVGGRFLGGISGRDDDLYSWTGLSAGFGARLGDVVDVGVFGGPEWAQGDVWWRSDLLLTLVLPLDGGGAVWHSPRKPD